MDSDLAGMIAERRLTLLTENGEPHDILVRISNPEQSLDDTDFSCACQIVGYGDDKVHRIYGLDALQSLQLTLKFLSLTLNRHRQEANGRIYWREPGDDMGFAEVEQGVL